MAGPAVALLDVANLAFGFASTPLVRDVTFRLEAGDRVALVAPNGTGKTTLLRLVAGELTPDTGVVVRAKGARLGFYRQSEEAGSAETVRDTLRQGFAPLVALEAEVRAAEEAAASGEPEAIARLTEATERYLHAGADQLDRRLETIATRLGFAAADLERSTRSLSGGERGRLALGAVLAGEPELLLLDEPTNHLDLDTIRWLEGFLAAWRGAVLVVSHDRAFLDAVCPVTLELGRRALRRYEAAFSQYQILRREELERERRAAAEQANEVARTEEFIRRNLAGQKTKQAQARRTRLEKLERVERPEDVWGRAERGRFRFAEAPRSGDVVLTAEDLSAERGGRVLFAGFTLRVRRGDRIGIIGPNGCGKTTLLSLLSGRGAPGDRGQVRRGTNLLEGYFDQHLGSLDPSRTAVEQIRTVRADLNVDAAREYLARFRLTGDDPLRSVASLSGGEQTRVALAKLLLEPKNLLFLDEPTNHLDIPAAEILEEALVLFPGTVLFVSHDRRFLEHVSTRTIAFGGEGPDTYEGGFGDYLAMLERRQRLVRDGTPGGAASVRAEGAERHRERRAAARELERKQRRLAQLEEDIANREAELGGLRAELAKAPGDRWEALHELAERERSLGATLDRLLGEWTALSEELGRG
ncbi:MAG TPA: ABC-F family ATP-binding cassette domain-containing protein [Polyangiaceae bacterium]|nr:ABC-F family ATP-binding cassette domain-containing protein [Polyangiaceae bacterium]